MKLKVPSFRNGKSWKGSGMSQEDFMRKDECLLLDERDRVVGQASKQACHRFSLEQPRGLLHRAFSVFLFDEQGRLLLQQRAAAKITFPDVWTNTCCSHPLSGYKPGEVDGPEDLADGSVMGVKRAAVRKLLHELGIPAADVPLAKFKFLTRLHYWAADTGTHGPQSPWGEHEIDYILFIQAKVRVTPNPEEVQANKYVTQAELQAMMAADSGLLWSPWFRIIATRFLPSWWADLPATLTTDRHVDLATIHRFDPPPQFMGGAGHAGPYLDKPTPRTTTGPSGPTTTTNNNGAKKQGAYGKVKTHGEAVLTQLLRVDEVACALRVKFGRPFPDQEKAVAASSNDDDVAFCFAMLDRVSRSFAAVIRQLPPGLCVETVVFYLVLRALDTVEDDMEAFDSAQTKVGHLRTFYEAALEDTNWRMTGVGKGDEARLLEEFPRVTRVFQSLAPGMRRVIQDITRRMGNGMADFVSKDLGQGTVSLREYDLYCHYVAGLVGEGLTRMFAESGLEDPLLPARGELSNSMGLFLQKTNIIRDYLEDYVDGRAFWPQEVWKLYSPTGSLGAFALPQHRLAALACLNHLVTDALQHVPDCLAYMERLRTPEVFRFCAIPQVMAIATLEKVYSNADVFSGVVKIRKGLACKLILEANDMPQLYACFARFAARIAATAEGLRGPALAGTPTQQRTLALCRQIQALCASKAGGTSSGSGGALYTAGVVALVGGPVLAAVARLVGLLAPFPSPAALRRGLPPTGQGAATSIAQAVLERVAALSPADGLRLAVCLVVAGALTVVLSAVVLAVLPSTPRPKSAAAGAGAGVGVGGGGNGKKQGNGAAAGKGKAVAASQ